MGNIYFDRVSSGFCEKEINYWEDFEFIIKQIPHDEQFVWRGQASAEWTIEASLQREIKKIRKRENSININESIIVEHLNNFKMACRGRKGKKPQDLEEDEWWALGQHFGLCTPLLDWTTSPFVAAYFAFIDEENKNSDRRAIYGISRPIVKDKSDALKKENKNKAIIEFVEPKLDGNPRLTSQGGLFTKSSVFSKDWDIKGWIEENFKGDNNIHLIKITIPNSERIKWLRSLDKMNINHLSLFPDLFGASIYCNNKLALLPTIQEGIIEAFSNP